MSDEDKLRWVFELLRDIARQNGVDLKWVEVKGTIYYFPQLEAV